MNNLNISVVNKVAKYLQRDGDIVCGNSDYQITFAFDEEWNKYETKTARFIWNGKYWDQMFSGNVCPVPKITQAVFVLVGVYAGDLSTTTPASIPCKRSILCDTAELSEGCIEGLTDKAVEAAYRAESAAIRVEEVLAKFDKVSVLGYVDENNVITLVGSLPDTTYTLKYEMEDGTLIDIGEFAFDGSSSGGNSGGNSGDNTDGGSSGGTTTDNNLIKTSVNTDGTPFGTDGIVEGKRWGSSGTLSNGQANTTGLIACKAGDIVLLEKCGLYQGKLNEAHRVTFWNTSKGILGYEQPFYLKGTYMTNVQFTDSFVTQFTVVQDGFFAVSGINKNSATSAELTDYLDANSKITIKSAS